MDIKLVKSELSFADSYSILVNGGDIAMDNIFVSLTFEAVSKNGDKKEFDATYFCLSPGQDGWDDFGFQLDDDSDFGDMAEFYDVQESDLVETLCNYNTEARSVFLAWFKAQAPFKEIEGGEERVCIGSNGELCKAKTITPKDWV